MIDEQEFYALKRDVERLKQTLGTLICWLDIHLGEQNTRILLERLEVPHDR